MKTSNYNFMFELEESEDILMYNAMTNSLALIENENYNIFKKFHDEGIMIEDDNLIDELKKGGFLIHEDFNEINELKNRMWKGRYSAGTLSLTIAPTSDCNFRCTYCYEKDVLKDSYMTRNIEDSIIELVKNYSKNITNLSINWYGGEPLLGLKTIDRLSRRFIEICEEQSIEYSAGMITNGYLLNKDTIELLNELKVSFYQITIDGLRETHNVRRPLENGEGTFDVIFNNIIENIDILPSIGLRINIDRTNYDSCAEILKLIENNGLESKIRAYLGKVTNDNEELDLNNYCFDTNEFAKIDLEYITKNSDKVDWFSKYPSIKFNFCGADAINSYVINSDGELYKCWNDIGIKEKSIGNILFDNKVNHKVYFDYMLFDPTEDKQCSKCKILPICMGGCPFYRIKGNNNDNCSIYKSSLKDYITYISRMLISEREKNYEGVANI